MVRTTFLAAMILAALTSAAQAQRFISFNGNSPTGGTWYVGTGPVGSVTVTPLFSASLAPNESGSLLADRMMPAAGIPNAGKRAFHGFNAVQVFHADTVQFWFSIDGESWTLVPTGGAITLNQVQMRDEGSNGFTLAGAVPAVSAWGLVALTLCLTVAGTVVLARRRTSAV